MMPISDEALLDEAERIISQLDALIADRTSNPPLGPWQAIGSRGRQISGAGPSEAIPRIARMMATTLSGRETATAFSCGGGVETDGLVQPFTSRQRVPRSRSCSPS